MGKAKYSATPVASSPDEEGEPVRGPEDPNPLEEALEVTPLQPIEPEDVLVVEPPVVEPPVNIGQIIHFHVDDENGQAIRLQAEVANIISFKVINLRTFKFRGARWDHFGVQRGRRVGQWDLPY